MKAHSGHWQNRVLEFLSCKSSSSGLAVVAAIASPLLTVSVAGAQQALPPPPSISNPNALPSLAPVPPPTPGLPTALPGAGFSYPQDASGYPAPMPVPPTAMPGAYSAPSYQVIVNGDSPYLLQQIQLSEQSAYVREYQGRRVIQAGEFQTEGDAQNRVVALAQQGVAAQVVSGNAAGIGTGMNTLGAAPNIAKVSHFQVVVPTRPELFATLANKMVGMGVRPDAIQAKRAPLGPHLAVGPFLDQKEAESVSQYLRTGGMDARVFFVK